MTPIKITAPNPAIIPRYMVEPRRRRNVSTQSTALRIVAFEKNFIMCKKKTGEETNLLWIYGTADRVLDMKTQKDGGNERSYSRYV